MSSSSLPETLADAERVESSIDFPVVGIGASAGGLEALIRFFEQMPSGNGMAFVVILHLSPKHASNVDAVLQAVTRMPVRQVTESVSIAPDHVYVIPPNHHLSMNDSQLRVIDLVRPRGRHVAIDLFFRTLALVHRERAVAIVLSGTGSDGAVGITRIKEQGGVTIAQAPLDAEFDAMPRAAIGTGHIDWVLPVVEMPRRLVDMWANMRAIELPAAPDDGLNAETPSTPQRLKEAEDALREIMGTLRARTGHDFRHYKRATVLRRIERRLQVNGLPNLPSYCEYLQGQHDEAQGLLKDLLIGVTNFFRDREAFEALEREVVPQLFDAAGRETDAVRAWVAGCASGEEAYSVAMLLAEQAERVPAPFQVFASDIDEQAIGLARAGTYPDSIVADVPPVRLRRFFVREGSHYRVRKDLRETILFATHNILRDPPFSKLDLICCRNLLIYLDRDVHAEVMEMLHFALRPGGYLFLGSAESADAVPHLFAPVDKKHRIYRANVAARGARLAPALPLGGQPGRAPGIAEPPPRSAPSHAEMHQRLIEQYAPPSVLLDAGGAIVHLSARAGRFLRHAGGAPSHRLLALVHDELRLELRTALYQAQQSQRSVEARRVQMERDGRRCYVKMTVRPVADAASGTNVMLVLFDETEDSTVPDAVATADDGREPLIAQLESELRRTNEELRDTIEHAETSAEELKASNEELQAINEELRSTSEELETGKEELHSVNEELVTVNQELKMKVEETAKINDDLQNLIASTDIAIVFIDRGLAIKRYTPRASQVFSIIPGDVGRSLLDITHRLGYDGLADDAGEAFASLRVIEREVRSSDGKWYLSRILPYRTADDRIEGAVLTFIDITGRRDAEERMRLVAESTKDYAIITLDLGGRITTWNQGAERMFGYAGAEAVGLPMANLFVPDDRERGAPQEEMRRAREDGRAEDDRWHLRKDGTRFFCSGILTPLHVDGRLQGYAKIARDLTGTKHAENRREARLREESAGREQAQASSDMKDEFLAVMSHELKNPLNLIQLNAELLSRLPEARTSPVLARAAETIRKTVHSQAQIIDDLLDLSRINTGKLALDRRALDWAELVRDIVAVVADDVRRKGITLEAELPPALVVQADAVRIEQVVWNLVSNALKFTPPGGCISLRLRVEGEEGVLEVHDSGRGIAPEFLPKVFDMFQQADPRSSRKDGGLGIGLALARHIVLLHGGRIEATSEGSGAGACFRVGLPMQGSARSHRNAGHGSGQRLPAGLRALVVDDDADSLETLRDLLVLEGIDVTTARSAQAALDAVAGGHFDVVVSDIGMPDMDGYEFVGRLRAEPATAQLPLIAISGFGRAVDVRRARAAGFDAHLAKPVTFEQVTDTLLNALANRA